MNLIDIFWDLTKSQVSTAGHAASDGLTFLLQGAFQCSKVFIEDKINLRTVALKEGLQFTPVNDICGEMETSPLWIKIREELKSTTNIRAQLSLFIQSENI